MRISLAVALVLATTAALAQPVDPYRNADVEGVELPAVVDPEDGLRGVIGMRPGLYATASTVMFEHDVVAKLERGALRFEAVGSKTVLQATVASYLAKPNALAGNRRTEARAHLHKGLPFRVLLDLAVAAKHAGLDRFHLAGRHRSITYATVTLPSTPTALPTDIDLVVSITPKVIRLWSQSGREGSLKQPKLQVATATGVAGLVGALEEITKRRWPDAKRAAVERSAADRSVVLQVDPTVDMQTLANVIWATRASAERELFPHITLAGSGK